MPTMLTALLIGPLVAAVPIGGDFEAPVQITNAGKVFDDMIFPTPILYDIDGDDERELVIGDLRGHIWICEAENTAAGIAWTEKKQVTSEGKPLKLNNW